MLLSVAPEILACVVLALPLLLIVYGALNGRVATTGLWRDSFETSRLSPARVFQFIMTVLAAAVIIAGLAQSGWTEFASLPRWLSVTAASGNLVYLGAKFAGARRSMETGSSK